MKQFASKTITQNSKLPEYYRSYLVRTLTDISFDIFESEHEQITWISLLAVESRFERTAKSPKGAIGIGQLMPQFRDDFTRLCGLPKVSERDLWDVFTNAYLSACYFKWLIDQNAGNTALALIAYNAGPNSADLKAAKQGRKVSSEPSNYVTKIQIIKEQK